jgi:hypothetical protein
MRRPRPPRGCRANGKKERYIPPSRTRNIIHVEQDFKFYTPFGFFQVHIWVRLLDKTKEYRNGTSVKIIRCDGNTILIF